jgi:hypothetical protein
MLHRFSSLLSLTGTQIPMNDKNFSHKAALEANQRQRLTA